MSNVNVMDRWMRESLNALEVMETQRAEHEAAMEAAMDAIRRHSTAIEKLERDIAIVRDALETATLDDEADTAMTVVHRQAPASGIVAPPIAAPPLHGPRLVAP